MENQIETMYANFNVNVEVVESHIGPTVTTYEVKLGKGIRIKQILGFETDLALALGVDSVRYQVPFKNTGHIGIEIANADRQTVKYSDIQSQTTGLEFVVGKSVTGESVKIDLATLPHLLVAGQTGSGKSVALNCMISSLLSNNTPEELAMVMIDPKKVELAPYADVPHLMCDVVDDIPNSINVLEMVCDTMELRYKMMAEHRVRNIDGLIRKGVSVPKIVVVIDELADIMIQAKKEVEPLLVRLAQKSRAAGIHLVLATQRPSKNVITGILKANIPARMAFKVASGIDSRVILDNGGAECLLGQGDMLFTSPQNVTPKRIQGAFITDEQVDDVVASVESLNPVVTLVETLNIQPSEAKYSNSSMSSRELRYSVNTSMSSRELRYLSAY